MDYDLPTQFDLIVVGTGIVESIISAAASRIGKRVLHVDSNSYYGGQWASFNLEQIQQLPTAPFGANDENIPLSNDLYGIKHFHTEWHVPEQHECEHCKETLLKDSRKFNIDLMPKLQFARGEFVELLISSNIARYSEYRSVSRVLTKLNGLEVVPCSRSDVFANNKVTVIEKRMLMKLFTSLDTNETELTAGYEAKTFQGFLKDRKLTPNLIHYVLYAIANSDDRTLCAEGIKNTKRFLSSLGRFGKTPFLFSMYGSGEITQGFCRLSAVFGGIYALSQNLRGITVDESGRFEALRCGTQTIRADFLVTEAQKCPKVWAKSKPNAYISRAIFVTDKSILESEKEHLTLLLYPPEDGKNGCTVLELGTLTGTCPKDLYLVHMIMRQMDNPKSDFEHVVDGLFGGEDKPTILWSCYFAIPDVNDIDLGSHKNIFVCPGPDIDLDYDNSVRKAKDIFERIYPDCEFLPRAPDPEDIIIGDDNEGDGEGDINVTEQVQE